MAVLDVAALEAPALRELASLSRLAITELERLRQLVEHIPAVLYIDEVTEPGSRPYATVFVSPQVETVLGITQAEWLGIEDVWEQHVHRDDWTRISLEYADYLHSGGVLVQEYRIVRPDDGRTVWVRDECSTSLDAMSGRRIILGVMIDVSDHKVLEEQLRSAEANNRALIEQVPSVAWIEPLGENSEPAFVSSAVERVFGVGSDEWIGTNWWERHVHPDDRHRVLEARTLLTAGSDTLHLEYRMRTAAGREIWVGEISRVVMRDGRPWVRQGLLDDVTSRKQVEAQLRFRASHDPLTGLANRPLFDESLELALARSRRNNSEVAVLFVDIDGFKGVNDAYGHDAGDEVLRIVAHRLLQCARESDLVARRGGDEFLVLLPDIEASPAGSDRAAYRGVAVADFIVRRILDTMEVPIELPAGPVEVSLSIGQCVYPWDATDPKTMMAVADATMYLAKQDR